MMTGLTIPASRNRLSVSDPVDSCVHYPARGSAGFFEEIFEAAFH